MNFVFRATVLICLMVLTGCGSSEPVPVPLTVDEWKALPVAEKYNRKCLDRLKKTNPSFSSEEAWTSFMKEVLTPEWEKDQPGKKRNTGT